jgi:hypothetical protein
MKLFIKNKFTSEALRNLRNGNENRDLFPGSSTSRYYKTWTSRFSFWVEKCRSLEFTTRHKLLQKTRSPCRGFYFNKYVVSFIKFNRVVQEKNHRTRHAKLNHCIFDHRARKPLLASRSCLSACVSSFKVPRLQLYGDHVQLHIC